MGIIDNTPQGVKDVLDKPGVYAVLSGPTVWFMEVGIGGTCYQLKPETFKRDGVLSKEGWNPDALPIKLVQLTSAHIGLPWQKVVQLIAQGQPRTH